MMTSDGGGWDSDYLKPWSHMTKTSVRLFDRMLPKCLEQVACGQTEIFHLWSQMNWPCSQSFSITELSNALSSFADVMHGHLEEALRRPSCGLTVLKELN